MGVNIEIAITANSAGIYTLNLIANSNKAIIESNYDNNSVAETYRWAGYDGLAAYEFNAADGSYTFPVNTKKVFTYGVANFGTTDMTNVRIGYVLDFELQASWVMATVPAGKVALGSMTLALPTSGKREVGIVVDPFNEKTDPTRSDNLLMKPVTVIEANMLYTNNKETISKAMYSTEHGWTSLTFTCNWGESYYISDNNAVFTKKNVYIETISNRRPEDTPYTINVNGVVHKSSTGAVLRTFNMVQSSTIIPPNVFDYYSKENSDIVIYARNNTNYGSVLIVIYGGVGGATNFEHTVSLNV